MSHFSRIATRIADRRLLIQALTEMNVPFEEGDVTVSGYEGATMPCEIRIPTDVEGYDVGFRQNGGFYELVGDWFGLEDFDREGFINAVTQRYAYCAVKDQLPTDFQMAEERQESDNSIRIVLHRRG